ncbi:Histidinol dehydrogenase [Fusarium keratoplasticum]|uniref:Histidinol dehydrogenase n=1 Tax=Fusarium keratoplasticum TaxID=1328300 RepID=A0ACC0QRT0_9HYPO|nr:Histidinol dehydrogenase [Fusarium keratoplasticum]KAI8666006.1 Histidinol dehydrogenase [Fusarium keratoplasticum]
MAPQHLKETGVVRDIRAKGGKAVRTYSGKFDKWPPASFKLSDSQIRDCIAQVPLQTIKDIKTAQENVRKFAEVQRASTHICTYDHFRSQSRRGEASHCLHATHPRETSKCHYRRCSFVVADEIFVIGGMQAIAAMATGTETIKKVDFIAGPENAFVAETKRLLFGETGIDLVAGPTEVFIVADEAADLFTVATGMLSQAEYGPDTPEVLITTSEKMAPETIKIINKLLETLPTSELAERRSKRYQTMNGALFLGEKTCMYYGDKGIGTNHVLPTRKAGNYTGGLWVGKFLKTQMYQEIVDEKASGEMGRLCGRCSRAENFEGLAGSGDLRA